MNLFLLIVAAGFGLISSTAYYLYAIMAAGGAVYIYRAARIIRSRGDPAVLKVQGGVFSCYLAYWLLREYSAAFYLSVNNISLAFSGLIGRIISKPISMGMTYSGIDLIVLFIVAAVICEIAATGGKPYIGVPADILVIITIWGFYVGIWTVLAENSINFGLHFLEPLTGPLDFRFLLFLLLSAVFLFRRGKNIYATPGWRLPVMQLLFCVIAVIILLRSPGVPEVVSGRKIVFWDTGIDFSVPEKGKYGLERVGMFGVLPRYLENRGYECEIISEVDGGTLDGAAALVIINPMIQPTKQSAAAISDFVRNGGGVLAVGDHTGDEQIRKPLNLILSDTGIEFNFDSAMPFQSLWPNGYCARKHPIFHNIKARQTQVVVGASLKCGYGARPVLIGKTGFSDAGDIYNEADGYLGDMSFNRGERVGDLTLAAEARSGKGVYLAFGDTTLLQNTSLAYSAPFIDNIFAYITAGFEKSGWGGAGTDYAPGISGGSEVGSDYAPGISGGSEVGTDKAYNLTEGTLDSYGNNMFRGYCVIEGGHLPSFSFDKSGNAADGLIAGILRAGMMPYININENLSDVLTDVKRNVVAVALVEPAKSLSKADISAIDGLLYNGGTLFILGDYNSPAATKEICARYGAVFDDLPIGRISPASNPDISFWNACPVILNDNVGLPRGSGGVSGPGDDVGIDDIGGAGDEAGAGGTALVSVWDYPVICREPVYNGEIVIIGDAGFLLNKNLENAKEYDEGNIHFVEGMLERARDRYFKYGLPR